MNRYTTAELSQLFERHLSQMHIPDDPQQLYVPIGYAMAEGGKRIRPTLLLLAYNIFDDEVHRALDAALAVEMFHNFTLLHDDIMDNAAVRRGLLRGSVPAAAARGHAQEGQKRAQNASHRLQYDFTCKYTHFGRQSCNRKPRTPPNGGFAR